MLRKCLVVVFLLLCLTANAHQSLVSLAYAGLNDRNEADKGESQTPLSTQGNTEVLNSFSCDNETVKQYLKAAEHGDAEAQYRLGSCYNIPGTPEDAAWMLKWVFKDADDSTVAFQVTSWQAEALKWYLKAARQGHMSAQLALEQMQSEESVKWFQKAAEQGDAWAQYTLGRKYWGGWGVPKDYLGAAHWCQKAAEQGNVNAQIMLGSLYRGDGTGLKNYAEAVKWYRKAAEQGRSDAQYFLGYMYREGEGVPQNYTEALRWTREAADQGDSLAQYDLGVMYEKGQGVLRDYVQAHMWYNLAATDSYSMGAKEARDKVAKKMTPAQITEAQRMAWEWKPKGKD
jgi:hypothetical protein